MNYGQRIARLFAMDARVWERHANPWSVWTRVAAFPLLVLAIWSRAWLGWWALAPVAAMILFLWLNPRLFPPPVSTRSWASRAVLGERVWLNRAAVPIPEHHRRMALSLGIVPAVGIVPLAWGLADYDYALALLGLAIAMLGKLWFVDRMVWLFEDMKDRPEYRGWLR
jgi:hypothetical protein